MILSNEEVDKIQRALECADDTLDQTGFPWKSTPRKMLADIAFMLLTKSKSDNAEILLQLERGIKP